MCSKSFLARLEMYFNAKDEAQKDVKAESSLAPQCAVDEMGSPAVEDSGMKGAIPDPGMPKPIHLST
jgi:hypothetical protein